MGLASLLLLLTVTFTSTLQQTYEGDGSVFFTFASPDHKNGLRIVYRPHNTEFYSPGDGITACIHLGIAFPDRPTNAIYNYTMSQWANVHILDWSEKGKYYYLGKDHLSLLPGKTAVYDIRLYNSTFYGRWRCWREWQKRTPIYSDLNRYYRVPKTVRYCQVEDRSSTSDATPCSAVLNGTSSGDLQNKTRHTLPDPKTKSLKYLLYHAVAVAGAAVGCVGICIILTWICKKKHERQRASTRAGSSPPVTGNGSPHQQEGNEVHPVGWELITLPEYKDVPATDLPPTYEDSCGLPDRTT